jgi:hypothetical protein
MFAAWSAALYAVANRRSAERPATPASARARVTSAPWSRKMSTCTNGLGAEALGHELEDGRDLFAGYVELLDDFDSEILKVFDDSGHARRHDRAILLDLAG